MPQALLRPASDGPGVIVLADRVPRPGLRYGDHRLLQLLNELATFDPAPRVTLLVADWCARTTHTDLVERLGVVTAAHVPDWDAWFEQQTPDVVVIHGPTASRRFAAPLDAALPDVPRLVDAGAIATLDGDAPLAPLAGDDAGRAVTMHDARERDRRLLASAASVLCGSEHEAVLVRDLAASAPTRVLRSHADSPTLLLPASARRDVAMLGSFVEGVCSPDEAAVGFVVDEVWPRVRDEVDATLHVVGEDASPALRTLADGVRFHVARGPVTPSLTTLRAVVGARPYGRGVGAGPLAAVAAGVPLVADGAVADAFDLPTELRIGGGADALVAALVACVRDDATWDGRARATYQWAGTIGRGQYRAALVDVFEGMGLIAGRGAPIAVPEVEWAGREHGRWGLDPERRVAPGVPMLRLDLADQVTTAGVPDPEALLGFPLVTPYHEWIRERDPSPRGRWANEDRASSLPYQPVLSIVVVSHDTPISSLDATIASLHAQVYPRWEACIVDDGSTDLATLDALTRAAAADPRVRLARLESSGGAAAAANAALLRARGEFVAFVPPGGHLEPLALLEVVDLLNRAPELDILYTDEHEYDPATGQRINPCLKPSWSPDLLRSTNYVGRLAVFRRSVVEHLGGLREEFTGALDYDLVLRATAVTDRVGHVAWPLYRSDVGRAPDAAAVEAGRRALADAVAATGTPATVEDLDRRGGYRVRYAIVDEPRVGVAIPTRDRCDLLEAAISSIRERSTYRNIEITIIDNQSSDPATLEYLEHHDGPVLRYDAPFNYARMMNLALAACETDLLLFLNNDVEVHQRDWIEALVEHAQRPTVGAVGTRLWFPSGMPQHQGIFVGGGGGAVHADFVGAEFAGSDRHFIRSLGSRIANFSAVTGACLMARPAVLAEVGGFDERLHVAFNDVDLCLKLRARGYDIVCTPFASVVHEESATRGDAHPMQNDDWFRARWRAGDDFEDPYSNPNYDQHQRFALNPTWE